MAVWQTLSLRARLNTLLVLVMVLGLVVYIARLKVWSGLRAVWSKLWCQISMTRPNPK
jgi:hypothetical protein